jgi:hypothetical protein
VIESFNERRGVQKYRRNIVPASIVYLPETSVRQPIVFISEVAVGGIGLDDSIKHRGGAQRVAKRRNLNISEWGLYGDHNGTLHADLGVSLLCGRNTAVNGGAGRAQPSNNFPTGRDNTAYARISRECVKRESAME